MDQTRTPTRDQDQEGDGEDDDGSIEFLLAQIQARKAEKRELELRIDAARNELDRVEADKRSIAALAHSLEGKLARTRRVVGSSSKASEVEANRMKRTLKDLEAEKAKLADANAVLVAEISDLGVRLLAAAEREEVDLQILRSRYKLMEMSLLRLTEHMRQKEAEVKEKIRIGEAREKDLKEVVDAFEEFKTHLESSLAEFRSEIEKHLETQSEHDAAIEAIAFLGRWQPWCRWEH